MRPRGGRGGAGLAVTHASSRSSRGVKTLLCMCAWCLSCDGFESHTFCMNKTQCNGCDGKNRFISELYVIFYISRDGDRWCISNLILLIL